MKQNRDKKTPNEIMEKIHQDQIKMKPRFHFILGSFLLALGLAINFILAIFFFALVVFRLRIHAPFGYFWFGQSGLKPFLATFPWFYVFLGIAAILSGILLLRKYDFSYKKNFLMLILWLVVLVIGAGFLFDQMGLNERAEQLEAINSLYETNFGGENWLVGEVIKTRDNAIDIKTPYGEVITVNWNKETKLPSGQNFILGDRVKTIGSWQEEGFAAQGIDKIEIIWRKKMFRPKFNKTRASLKSQFLKSEKQGQ